MHNKIESMIKFKKAKNKKKMLNNPPKKETLLKGSKDTEEVKIISKPGEYGALEYPINSKKFNDNKNTILN